MIKEQLQATRKIVEAGWTQVTYNSNRFVSCTEKIYNHDELEGNSHHCLVGAVAKAIHVHHIISGNHGIIKALQAVLPCPLCDDECAARPLLNWNDKIGRTKEEVLDLIDKAIAQCDSPPNNSNT